MPLLEVLELAKKPIVLGVADFGRVEDVVAVVVMVDLVAKIFDALNHGPRDGVGHGSFRL